MEKRIATKIDEWRAIGEGLRRAANHFTTKGGRREALDRATVWELCAAELEALLLDFKENSL